MADKNPAAVSLGKLGGLSTSEKKKAAARLNGKKGGRRKKKLPTPLMDKLAKKISKDPFFFPEAPTEVM